MSRQATGCGKTHTISGNEEQPGIVFLIMKDLFARISSKSADTEFSLTVSYLEIYNETIRDLLEPEKGPLQLRESNGMATPANLSTKEPTSALDVVEWITLGNQNRTVNATEANATSSRSHAVLRVTVTQKAKAGGMTDTQSSATLSVIDLAGSERASVTKNKGDRLIEGANINRSLLALGNCINALCDPRKRGHVPYRDSKLTRLLKQSLGGNCKTVMIVCVSPSSAHYDETHNTLQYANRAKEIKTKAIRNVVSVDRHVAQYCQQIMQQAEQIDQLKRQLSEQSANSSNGDREEDMRAVATAKTRLHASWESGKDRQVAAERANAEKLAVDSLLAILQQWKTTALHGASTSSTSITNTTAFNTIQSDCDSMILSLSETSARLRTEISSGTGAMDSYSSALTTASSSMRSSRPSAWPTLQLELKVLDSKLSTALAEAREQGVREASRCQARVMNILCDARAKIGNALEAARDESSGDRDAERTLVRLANNIDSASKDAFVALIGGSSVGALKRDAGSRSPLEVDILSKAPRTTAGSFGAVPPALFALSPQPSRVSPSLFPGRKASPRKSVSHPRRIASPKKRKGVQWRDETGDGWELEDVKWRSPATPDSVGSGSSCPQLTVTSAPSPRTTLWTAPSMNVSTAASSAAEMMALKARSSATGALRNKASAPLGSSKLSRVSEIDPSTFFATAGSPSTAMPPPPVPSTSRITTSAVADTSIGSSSSDSSFSMAATSSGLYAPVVPSGSSLSPSLVSSAPLTPRRAAARRRISQIGAQRSAKASRRTSFVPPTPVSSSSFSTGATPAFGRKPARIAGGGPLPAIPGSVMRHKSPRKLLSAGSASVRRASMAPLASSTLAPASSVGGPLSSIGNLAASVGMTPTVSIGGFGAKSAARIAARRESSLAAQQAVMAAGAGSSVGAKGAGGRSSSEGLLGGSKRESPSSAAPGAASGATKTVHWR